MCRFYGWTHDYIDSMTFETALEYWQAITMIEAQEFLQALKCSEYANMEAKDKQKLSNYLQDKAYFQEEQKVLKTTDIIKYESFING